MTPPPMSPTEEDRERAGKHRCPECGATCYGKMSKEAWGDLFMRLTAADFDAVAAMAHALANKVSE